MILARRTLARSVQVLLLLLGTALPARSGPLEDRQAALALLGRGVAAFEVGDVVAATRHWSEAVQLCRIAGMPQLEAEALARRGEAYRVEGLFREAATDMAAALARAQAAGDELLVAATTGALGNISFMSRRTAVAEPLLRDSLAGARRLGDGTLAGASANDLGNLYAATERPDQAASAYAEAVQHAEMVGDPALAATAEVNAARLAFGRGDQDRSARLIGSASARLGRMAPSYRVGLAFVAAGSVAAGGERPPSPSLAEANRRALDTARNIATRLDNPVIASLASGGQGRLLEQAGRYAEAARLTQQAIFEAQRASANDIAFRWEWQAARLSRALRQEDAALAGYRRAVATLQSVRQDIPIEYRDGRSSFRSTFGPLFLQYADLLLRRAERDPRGARSLIREARDTLERLKETELQDYFRDPCVTSFEALSRGVERIAPNTAIIYPVILPDRLALLVSVEAEDRQIVVPIAEPELRAEAERFRLALERRATNEYLIPARRLYDLIAAPVEAMLPAHVDTLVIVPDGVLRTIPFAALHNGRRFLVERYALATAPGLRLVDPQSLAPGAARTLAAGLSQSRHGFPALPSVVEELATINRLQRSTNLLDRNFLRQRFAREMRDGDFTVVHIASHAEIGSDPSRTFVLSYDGEISLDELEAVIKQGRFRERSLELLSLSACQTAAGDDRAALGLAGLALKAGARSALATLWFVNDQASGLLMVEFYKQLRSGRMSKAHALQAAQRRMLDDPLLVHPAYWAGFLLIGNWL